VSRADAQGKKKTFRYVGYGAVVVLLGVSWLVQWAMGRETGVTWDEAPAETLGVWTSEDPRYEGRALEIGPTSVTLRVGDVGTAVGGVLDVVRELFDQGERFLSLEYRTADGPDAIEMVMDGVGTMHMRTQPEITWTVERRPGYVAPPPPTLPSDGPLIPFDVVAGVSLALLAAGGLHFISGVKAPARDLTLAAAGPVPKLARGVWTTQDPRFVGESIRIGSGYGFSRFNVDGVREGGEVESVDQWKEDGNRVISIHYRTPDGLQDLNLIIDRSGHMRLKDGPNSVWVKRIEIPPRRAVTRSRSRPRAS